MTVSTTDNTKLYTGDGSTTQFAFPYIVYDSTHLTITINGTPTSSWTAQTYGDPAGVTITFTVAPANSSAIIIQRIVPTTQDTDLENFDGNPADVTEKQFDLLAMADQQVAEQLDRTIRVPIGTSLTSNDISGTVDATERVITITTDGPAVGPTTASLDTLAAISSDISAVAAIDTEITTVAGISGNVTTVAGIAANVTTVAGISANVTTVAGNTTNINTVAGDTVAINTVATNIADVNSAADAVASACLYKFSTSVTMADPTTGYLRFNNATPASVTAIAIDDQTAQTGNPNIAAYIATWDDSTGSIKGKLRISKGTDPATFAIYNITGLSDNSGWTELAVTYVDGAGTISNNDNIYISFCPNGNDGTSFSKTDITGQTSATIASGDSIVFSDVSDSGNLKKTTMLATNLNVFGSGAETSGKVPIADGSGNVAWGTVGGGFTATTVLGDVNWDSHATALTAGIYKTTGTYTQTQSTPLMGLAHEGFLEVFRIDSDANRIVQRWTEGSTGDIWQRATSNGGTTWTMWDLVTSKTDKTSCQKLYELDALKTTYTSGDFISAGITCDFSGTSSSVTNLSNSAGSIVNSYVTAATGTATNGQAGIKSKTTFTGNSTQQPNTFTRLECLLNIGTAVSDATNRYRAQFGFDISDRNNTNVIGFAYIDNENSGNWITLTDNSGTETVTNTSVAPTVTTGTSTRLDNPQKLRIEVEKQTRVRFYIDDVLVGTHTTNIPTAASGIISAFVTKTAGTSSREIAVGHIKLQMFK